MRRTRSPPSRRPRRSRPRRRPCSRAAGDEPPAEPPIEGERLGVPYGSTRVIADYGRPRPSYVFLALVSILTLAADLGSKAWAEQHLDGNTVAELWKNHLTLLLAKNRGGAWGLLQSTSENVRRPFFLLVSVAAIAFIMTLYRRLQPHQRALKWGLPLVLGGALGNVFDRIRYGHVIDFIDYRADWMRVMNEKLLHNSNDHWPTFNIADVAICVGVGLMAIDMFTSKRGWSDGGEVLRRRPRGEDGAARPARAPRPAGAVGRTVRRLERRRAGARRGRRPPRRRRRRRTCPRPTRRLRKLRPRSRKEVRVHPDLFKLFGVAFPSYFVLLLSGFLFATAIGALWARRIGESPDVIVDLGLAMLLAGVAGAPHPARARRRLLLGLRPPVHRSVAGRPGRSTRPSASRPPTTACGTRRRGACHPKAADCFAWAKFWAGGLTYYGGLSARRAAAWFLLKRDRFPFWKAADMAGFTRQFPGTPNCPRSRTIRPVVFRSSAGPDAGSFRPQRAARMGVSFRASKAFSWKLVIRFPKRSAFSTVPRHVCTANCSGTGNGNWR